MQRPVICVEQPIGIFYLTSLKASDVISRVRYKPRSSVSAKTDDIQRSLSAARVKEIAEYTEDPDATFPTPIILACSSEEIDLHEDHVEIPDGLEKIGDVIDGQHRLEGLRASRNAHRFELPVVLMFDLTAEEKAYVFSIINSKQTPVSASLIYDLFELSESRSPAKTCHEIARAMNSRPGSPFYQGLKMLGRKEIGIPGEPLLSQGSFVKYLLKLISRDPAQDLIDEKRGMRLKDDPDLPLRKYYILGEDAVIAKIVDNYFSAVREQFPVEWDQRPREFVLRKTVGFSALMKALRRILGDAYGEGRADKQFFAKWTRRFQENLAGTPLTSANFPSSEAGAGSLARVLLGEAV